MVRNLDGRDSRKRHEWRRSRITVDDRDLLAERPRGVGKGQLRPDRIAVRAGVRRDEEAMFLVDGVDYLLECLAVTHRTPGHSGVATAAHAGFAGCEHVRRPTYRRRT